MLLGRVRRPPGTRFHLDQGEVVSCQDAMRHYEGSARVPRLVMATVSRIRALRQLYRRGSSWVSRGGRGECDGLVGSPVSLLRNFRNRQDRVVFRSRTTRE
jgi:hypothetical protein